MNLKSLAKVAASKASRQLLVLQKHSPTIMFVAGVAGVVGTIYLTARATLKLEEIVSDTKDDLAIAADISERENETEGAVAGRKAVVYGQAFIKLAKLYAPAATCGAVSIALLTRSHVVLTNRNTGLLAAYAAIDKGFKEYRKRVIAELGEEKDTEFRYGLQDRDIIEETKNGPVVKRTRDVVPNASIYAQWFDDSNRNWTNRQEKNYFFLRQAQNYANDRLQARGHIFLNEVYDLLGMERTQAGQVVGWVLGNKDGDNVVDFGLDLDLDDNDRAFRVRLEGRADIFLVDFNVDGPIWDMI